MIGKHVYLVSSEKQTRELGKKYSEEILSSLARVKRGFARRPLASEIICLYGDLGNGKTTFVQGLAEGLGIKQRIISPTFTIVREYEMPVYSSSEGVPDGTPESRSSTDDSSRQARIINFYHIDLYRIQSENDLKTIGIEEILSDNSAIVAIEWAEKLGSLLPEKRWEARFDYIDENKRKISLQKTS